MKTYNLPYDLIADAIPDERSVIIRAYQAGCNSVKNKIVLHRNMINMLVSGTKTIMHAGGTTTINENEFLILSSGNILTSEVIPAGSDAFTSVLLYFSNTTLADFFIKYQSLSKENKSKADKRPFLKYEQDAFICNYKSSLQFMLQLPGGISAEMRQLKLEELLLYLLDKDADKLRSLLIVSKDDEDLQLRKAVESNIGNPITVEELAFLCNNSLSTFKRRFSKIYNTSPQKWLLQQKMELAAKLLAHPDERSGLVYQKVGYENHSSFTQAFKQHYGLTPTHYQEQYLGI